MQSRYFIALSLLAVQNPKLDFMYSEVVTSKTLISEDSSTAFGKI